MLSRAQRRFRDRVKKTGAEATEEKRRGNPIVYGGGMVILLIIAVTFIGTPAVRQSSGRGGIVFGSFAGKDIAYIPGNYFAMQRELIGEQAQASGEAVDNAGVVYQIWREAFNNAVRHTAVLLDAERSGLSVSRDSVSKAIYDYGPYQENGKFSESKWRRASASEQQSTWTYYQEQLIEQRYFEDVIVDLRRSTAESDKLLAMASPERRFSYVAFALEEYPDSKIVEYAAANAQKFSRIKISRILVKAGQSEAESIDTRLKADPLKFEEIAKTNAGDSYASAGGAMGWQYYYELALDFDTTAPVDAIFALGQGQISDPLQGKYGWMIFRCDEAPVAIDTTQEEGRTTVRTYLERYEAGTIQDYALELARSFVSRARQEGFTKTAATDRLTVDSTSWFPLNYQNVFSLKPVESSTGAKSAGATALADALYSEDFFRAAFGIKRGEVTDPVVLGQAVLVLTFDDERSVPESDAGYMSDYYAYLAQQADAADLEASLMDPTKLKDRFDETYQTYLVSSGGR